MRLSILVCLTLCLVCVAHTSNAASLGDAATKYEEKRASDENDDDDLVEANNDEATESQPMDVLAYLADQQGFADDSQDDESEMSYSSEKDSSLAKRAYMPTSKKATKKKLPNIRLG